MGQDQARAVDLYLWGSELAGAWHAHLSFVEVVVRNAMDRQLSTWNASQRHNGNTLTREWTAPNGTGRMLHRLIGTSIDRAREWARDEANLRDPSHPRCGVAPTHDDVIAQLTFGTWSRLLRYPHQAGFQQSHQRIWDQALKLAFPHANQRDEGLLDVGGRLERLRVLRNRVAHHDNLLHVHIVTHLNSSLVLLGFIGQDYPDLVMAKNSLRRLVREDPRK